MIERDYIMRMVQQLTHALLRLFKLKEQEEYDQAQEEVGRAWGELFGIDAELIHALDTAMLAQLLGHRERIKACATLLLEEGDLHRRQGQAAAAETCMVRALELFLEALVFESGDDPDCRRAIADLRSQIATERLSPRAAQLLQENTGN